MIEVGQLRRWVQRIPALPRESEPGTLFFMSEEHDLGQGELATSKRWSAVHGGVSKWYYEREIEQFSEVVSD
jgi:hypothetical protein